MHDELRAATYQTLTYMRQLNSVLNNLAQNLNAFNKTTFTGDEEAVRPYIDDWKAKLARINGPLREAEDQIQQAGCGWWGPSIDELTGNHPNYSTEAELDAVDSLCRWIIGLANDIMTLLPQLKAGGQDVLYKALPNFDLRFLKEDGFRIRTELDIWRSQIVAALSDGQQAV